MFYLHNGGKDREIARGTAYEHDEIFYEKNG